MGKYMTLCYKCGKRYNREYGNIVSICRNYSLMKETTHYDLCSECVREVEKIICTGETEQKTLTDLQEEEQ